MALTASECRHLIKCRFQCQRLFTFCHLQMTWRYHSFMPATSVPTGKQAKTAGISCMDGSHFYQLFRFYTIDPKKRCYIFQTTDILSYGEHRGAICTTTKIIQSLRFEMVQSMRRRDLLPRSGWRNHVDSRFLVWGLAQSRRRYAPAEKRS